jgi:2-oxoisovalerate dehydrogenase E1 component
MPGETIDGNDVEAVYKAAAKAVENVRAGRGPRMLECVTYRWHGHMLGDDQRYRAKEEVEEWKARCPIKIHGERLVSEGIITSEQADDIRNRAGDMVVDAVHFASEGTDPDPGSLRADVYAADPPIMEAAPTGATSTITGSSAINLALAEEMRRDPSVFLMGEDVALGGYMAVTNNLVEEFGADRVRDTPISEYAIVGAAVGAAMSGLRPVAEILFSDFITTAMDPIVNQAAKLRYMSGGQYRMPLVVRAPGGVGLGVAAQHSQSFEALLMGIPGLVIAAPGTPRDCRGMLKTAIRSDNPVLFFEHKLLYLMEGEVPEDEELIPFGKAAIRREGADVTIVALLYTVNLSMEAAEQLAAEGIESEVIDLRTLSPLDTETVLNSVAKTGRLLTVEEGPVRGGWGAEVVARAAAAAHGLLQAPPVRLGASDNPIPFNKGLENLSVPDTDRIVSAVRKLLA